MAFFLNRKNVETKNLGIYIHIPFCKSKCEYCDFYSLSGARDGKQVDNYLQALADHMAEAGKLCPDHIVDTVYFGGGTPSFFGAEKLDKILDEVQRSFRLGPDPEITLEANPDSISEASLKRLIRAGFNRISIGVQSDDDAILTRLGRPHTYEMAVRAMQAARAAGFANISLDLMYGLPSQTVTGWEETLQNVVKLRPEHISCYALKVEEHTPLWRKRDEVNLPDDDTQAEMYLKACEHLETLGYEHYEISNFAKPGFASRHNLKYWMGGEYLGFGPSAASDFGGKRFTIMRDLKGYNEGIAKKLQVLSECESIAPRERAGEYLMLRLRTHLGINGKEYEKRFLLPFEPLEARLRKFQDHGLTEEKNGNWRLTEKGWLLSNRIILQLQEDQERSQPITRSVRHP